MILLTETNRITKKQSILTMSENNTNLCQVDCTGRKNKWSHVFLSNYGSYAMLRDRCMLDLPGRNFLLYQINEHFKGGHYEYEMQLLTERGNVLNEFSSRITLDFWLEKKNLWFLKSGEKLFDFTSDIDLDLIKLNKDTGEVKNRIKLNYQKLLERSYKIVIAAKLSEKRRSTVLKIQYKDEFNNTQSKHIPLSQKLFI